MMMKRIVLILLILGFSCNEPDSAFDNFQEGALITFETRTESNRINALNVAEYFFSAELEDVFGNVHSYSLRLIYGDSVVNDFTTLTAFPATLEFTGQDILEALNITQDDVDLTENLQLIATIVTTTGETYNYAVSNFNLNDNVQEGGDASGPLFLNDNLAFNQAVNFRLSFFIPPPQKLRGTSFEEPNGAPLGTDYTRDDAIAEGELLNNDPNLRSVMYTALGNGFDDEIGFRTFFEDTGLGGFTSEEIGVSSDAGEVGGEFLDGNQAYQIEDTDGTIRIEFDRVEVDVAQNPTSGIQIQYHPADTGNSRESEDFLIISALVERADNSTETIELTNINGLGMNEGIGVWNLSDSGFLTDVTAYTLTVEVNVNGGSEDMYFDQMLVYILDN